MRVLWAVGRELLLSLVVLLVGTLLLFFLAFSGSGELQKEKLGLDVEKGALHAYIGWWSGLLGGEIGGEYQSSEILIEQLKASTLQTTEIVGLTLFWSTVLSLLLAMYFLRREQEVSTIVFERILYFSGAVPVFVIPLVIYRLTTNASFLFVDPRKSFLESLLPFAVASLILAVGSGVLGELVRLVKQELKRILNEPYIQAARLRGARTWVHVAVSAVVPLSSMFVSRIPYFIGAAIIVEYTSNIHGLGEQMLRAADTANFAKLMLVVMIILVIVLASRLVNKLVIAVFDPRNT